MAPGPEGRQILQLKQQRQAGRVLGPPGLGQGGQVTGPGQLGAAPPFGQPLPGIHQHQRPSGGHSPGAQLPQQLLGARREHEERTLPPGPVRRLPSGLGEHALRPAHLLVWRCGESEVLPGVGRLGPARGFEDLHQGHFGAPQIPGQVGQGGEHLGEDQGVLQFGARGHGIHQQRGRAQARQGFQGAGPGPGRRGDRDRRGHGLPRRIGRGHAQVEGPGRRHLGGAVEQRARPGQAHAPAALAVHAHLPVLQGAGREAETQSGHLPRGQLGLFGHQPHRGLGREGRAAQAKPSQGAEQTNQG